MANIDELACVYASLILADDQVAITSDKIATILKAAAVSVEPYWPGLFAKALDGLNVRDLISSVGSSAGSASVALATAGSAPAPSAPASESARAADEPKKEEKKKAESDESDEDMGFGLFD